MGKGEELTTTKYLIHAQITANGIVEKPDVVGAVFGQTEGLLSNDLDLRELQRTGRIGRIQVNIHSNSGRAKGEIVIPSSLDRVETAILAASLETINRVGPCEAEIRTTKVEDVRAVKREQVVNRAKEIYKNMVESVGPTSMRMIEEVREAMRIHEISEYGEDRLPAGPSIHTSDAIIVVEGRSDVLNLLKYGIKNTVAVEGVSVPHSIGELSKKRTTTAFVDGDRGGELILKELLQIGKVDYITRLRALLVQRPHSERFLRGGRPGQGHEDARHEEVLRHPGRAGPRRGVAGLPGRPALGPGADGPSKIGRASCRERV